MGNRRKDCVRLPLIGRWLAGVVGVWDVRVAEGDAAESGGLGVVAIVGVERFGGAAWFANGRWLAKKDGGKAFIKGGGTRRRRGSVCWA